MYYFRRNQEGQWYEFKLSSEEVAKVQTLTIVEGLKMFKKIDEMATKAGVTLTPERALAIFEKAAPTYTELGQDVIADQQNKKKAATTA